MKTAKPEGALRKIGHHAVCPYCALYGTPGKVCTCSTKLEVYQDDAGTLWTVGGYRNRVPYYGPYSGTLDTVVLDDTTL